MTCCFFSIQNLTRNEVLNTKSCFLGEHKNVKYVVFTELNEPKRDFSNAIIFSKSDLPKNF